MKYFLLILMVVLLTGCNWFKRTEYYGGFIRNTNDYTICMKYNDIDGFRLPIVYFVDKDKNNLREYRVVKNSSPSKLYNQLHLLLWPDEQVWLSYAVDTSLASRIKAEGDSIKIYISYIDCNELSKNSSALPPSYFFNEASNPNFDIDAEIRETSSDYPEWGERGGLMPVELKPF
jgi:hypothetical protein